MLNTGEKQVCLLLVERAWNIFMLVWSDPKKNVHDLQVFSWSSTEIVESVGFVDFILWESSTLNSHFLQIDRAMKGGTKN